jgi:hypothetical protein
MPNLDLGRLQPVEFGLLWSILAQREVSQGMRGVLLF